MSGIVTEMPQHPKRIADLPVRSCLVDGENIVVDTNGLSVFELVRYRQYDRAAPENVGR